MLIISIPKYSVIAKCLSYPGTGQRNFTLSSLHHGVLPHTPCVQERLTVSNISVRLAFPYITIFSAGESIIAPMSSFASWIPVRTP